MKKYLIIIILLAFASILQAQDERKKYPDPEFNNEVCYLKKDSISITVRLEKSSSKMESKTKMGGFGGAESGYVMEGSHSTVRIATGNELAFIYSTGAAAGSSAIKDSIMRANGMDPAMMGGGMGGFMDPTSMINLYKAETSKGSRKVVVQKSPGAMPFGSKKMRSADKFTFSVKKIREGYWLLVVDKPLAKGEYAFSMMNTGNMDGSQLMYSFGVD